MLLTRWCRRVFNGRSCRWNSSMTGSLQPPGAEDFPTRDQWWGREAGSNLPVFGMPDVDLQQLRLDNHQELAKLEEVRQRNIFLEQLKEGDSSLPSFECTPLSKLDNTCKQQLSHLLTSAFATFHLHVESRLTSALGQGFYTIGPCGEELLAPIGLVLNHTDNTALHYRHLAPQISRALANGGNLSEILLDRARGHVVSAYDPVTGGVHCALGGGAFDYLVTSTLASQAPSAVGRALGGNLCNQLKYNGKFPKGSVSFVSVGDGSVNHSHFLSAVNLAEYAKYRNFKCPTVFAVSDNGLSISLKGYDWLLSEFVHKLRMPIYQANGWDFVDVWDKTKRAVSNARAMQSPVFIVYKDLPRRFGHAATDRQDAYLGKEQIEQVSLANPMRNMCRQLSDDNVFTYPEMYQLFKEIGEKVSNAFDQAVKEPKLGSRSELIKRNVRPLEHVETVSRVQENVKASLKHVMRKHMTNVFDELLTSYKNLVYIGEDVVHGGYYLVTDQLAKKHPYKVQDFPPDETSLLGAAIGFSQSGLIPIVEIPYAKYLDCGADMFHEAVLMNWLSNGKLSNGMIIRLQGFGQGIFGGNFHTHNSLYLPPGLDVVCYSNGPDYARGMRYAVKQAAQGRVVMFVDCTKLLNLNHLHAELKDQACKYPFTESDEISSWENVSVYGDESSSFAIVTYGNGVIASLQAQKILDEEYGINNVKIIDSPYLSQASRGLVKAISDVDTVLFVDECKLGQNPYSGIAVELQNLDLLPSNWKNVTAQPTYNPLGSTLTFVSTQDVVQASLSLLRKKKKKNH